MVRLVRIVTFLLVAVALSPALATAQECDQAANLATIVNETSRAISRPDGPNRAWKCLSATADRADVLTAARGRDRIFFWFQYGKTAIALEQRAVATQKSAFVETVVNSFNQYFLEYKQLSSEDRQTVCTAGAGATAVQLQLQAISVRNRDDRRLEKLLMSATFVYSCEPASPKPGFLSSFSK